MLSWFFKSGGKPQKNKVKMMKLRQIKTNLITLSTLAMLSIGCSKDDENVIQVTVTTEDFSVAIDENPTEGQSIGKVTGKSSEGEVSFSLTTQTPEGAMSIDAKTGELKVKNASLFDFETYTSITGVALVKSGTISKEAKITVKINDVDDNGVVNRPPVIGAQTFTAKEDIKADVVIGSIVATDPESEALTFTLIKNSNDLFELTDTGELSLVADKKLDFETTSSHTLTVEVSDGKNKVSAEITITVENVAEPFITTWKTTTNNETITFQQDKDRNNYEYTIDWGDGTVENNSQITTKSHTYATAGTYTVSISGVFPMIKTTITSDAEKLQTIEQWGDNVWETMVDAFRGCKNMTYNATDVPNLSKVTDMTNMFSGCSKFNADINNWDVSNVTNMSGVFGRCIVFNSDLNNWDVSNVVNMSGMFESAIVFNGDIGNWNVGKVTNMLAMFVRANAFNSDISRWNVSNVGSMKDMFNQARSFNRDISGWDVSKVIDMRYMFFKALSFNGDLSTWDVSKVTTMRSMLTDANSFEGDLSTWDVSKVTDMTNMLDNTKISGANYDKILTKWVALPNLQAFVDFGAQGLTFCNAWAARSSLINDKKWTITGDTGCPR